jgi:hypothetical protein
MSLNAPTVDVRARIPDEIIRELVEKIATKFHPQRVILFGSYVYDLPRPKRAGCL